MKNKKKEKSETMDVYKDKQRKKMLKNDEITAVENAFMTGREIEVERKKEDLWLEKKETKSVELAQEEYQED